MTNDNKIEVLKKIVHEYVNNNIFSGCDPHNTLCHAYNALVVFGKIDYEKSKWFRSIIKEVDKSLGGASYTFEDRQARIDFINNQIEKLR